MKLVKIYVKHHLFAKFSILCTEAMLTEFLKLFDTVNQQDEWLAYRCVIVRRKDIKYVTIENK